MTPRCKNCGSPKKNHERKTLKCKSTVIVATYDPWQPGELQAFVQKHSPRTAGPA